MGLTEPCSCNVGSCTREWPRHPILEIECGQCGADAGVLCKRPSGHQPWGEHGRFHSQRYYDALDAGEFGDCPLDRCPESSAVSKARRAEQSEADHDAETEQVTIDGY